MRQYTRLLAASLPLLVAAACSDSSTSPQVSATRSLSAAPAFDYSGGGRFHFGDRQVSFTVTPDGGSFAINKLITIAFPANAVCDPALSTYGAGEWDNACVTAKRGITVTATTRLTLNGMQVDFQPDLRFAPDKQVVLSTDLFAPTIRMGRSFFAASPASLRPLAMFYSPSIGAEPVADYATDPSAVTQIDLQSGRVWRRVKHFSGYLMGSGAACNPSAGDPDCVAVHSESTP
jgi:hypothetical protein